MLPLKIFMSISVNCRFSIIVMKLYKICTDMLYRPYQSWERYCREETLLDVMCITQYYFVQKISHSIVSTQVT